MSNFNGTHTCSVIFGKTFPRGKGGETRLVSKKKDFSYKICNVGILCCRLDL